MRRTKLYIVLLPLLLWCLRTVPAQAHVLITDKTGKLGALLHISPDDDPVAGEPSNLFFDIQDPQFSAHYHNITLQIMDEYGHKTDVYTSIDNNGISSGYIFPGQGTYQIVLTVEDRAKSSHIYTLAYTQRINRGIVSVTLDQPTYAWADIGIVVAICGLLLLGIVGVNRRKEIAKYSIMPKRSKDA